MDSALLILIVVVILALAFDYINGFHDTANAVATVVSTNVLPGRTAVLMAGLFNFVGAFVGVGVAKTIGGDIVEAAYHPATGGRGRTGRCHLLEPVHLVFRHTVQFVACTHRRIGGSGLVLSRYQRGPGIRCAR